MTENDFCSASPFVSFRQNVDLCDISYLQHPKVCSYIAWECICDKWIVIGKTYGRVDACCVQIPLWQFIYLGPGSWFKLLNDTGRQLISGILCVYPCSFPDACVICEHYCVTYNSQDTAESGRVMASSSGSSLTASEQRALAGCRRPHVLIVDECVCTFLFRDWVFWPKHACETFLSSCQVYTCAHVAILCFTQVQYITYTYKLIN
jgi:hypothetical protein